MTRSALVYHDGAIAVIATNPLESAEFASPADQRATTRDDPAATARLAAACRKAQRSSG